eukprot:3392645-Amphidinium_carterae.1
MGGGHTRSCGCVGGGSIHTRVLCRIDDNNLDHRTASCVTAFGTVPFLGGSRSQRHQHRLGLDGLGLSLAPKLNTLSSRRRFA